MLPLDDSERNIGDLSSVKIDCPRWLRFGDLALAASIRSNFGRAASGVDSEWGADSGYAGGMN
jgi:hypothetical protein